MTDYTQKAYKIDKNFPLSCATFANYFLLTTGYQTVEPLARKAIEQTDVNAVASDGWFALARKEHELEEYAKANDYYNRADQARGGLDKGYLPAKFGVVQALIQLQDLDGAKFRLEKLLQSSKSLEAMTLLGCLYAEEAFSAQTSPTKEDKSAETRKAINLLEVVRKSWNDEKTKAKPDESVLLYLARLYEVTQPIESMKCLQLVEQMQLEKVDEADKPELTDDAALYLSQLREHLPPQLLNNMACFHYASESYDIALETFQIALNACVKTTEKQEAENADPNNPSTEADNTDTDALVTTISYNLARTYESLSLVPEAQRIYKGLLARHPDYTDASARLTYLALRESPTVEGPKHMAALYQTDNTNVEVRALMGWYLNRSKRRTNNIAEDQEQRHYKHTLQGYDKHDKYSLTGMGNIYLLTARDMPRSTDAEKDKRRKMYEKAVEFFDKALQLDPRNAYAAQGIAIALVDDKKDYSTAVQIFARVRDTIRDASVHINLGHVYAELKQYQRSIENYEIALKNDGRNSENAQILACLSRVWLLKGKADKSYAAMTTALSYSQRALATQPEMVHLEFNIAFVQFQIAQLINSLPETQRTLEEVQDGAAGLEDAIQTFQTIAKVKQPPYPRSALEQRAAMGKNTMRKQLERAERAQKEYEERNQEKLALARGRREEELRQREADARRRREEEEDRQRRVGEDRRKMIEMTQRITEQQVAEQAAREAAEWTEDEATGQRIKRKELRKRTGAGAGGAGGSKGKKRKGGADDAVDDFIEDDGDGSGNDLRGSQKSRSRTPRSDTAEPRAPPKSSKRRRLERKAGAKPSKSNKYKSSEIVVESDSDADAAVAAAAAAGAVAGQAVAAPAVTNGDGNGNGGGSGEETAAAAVAGPVVSSSSRPPRKRKQHRMIADEDDDDDEEVLEGGGRAVSVRRTEDDGGDGGDEDDEPNRQLAQAEAEAEAEANVDIAGAAMAAMAADGDVDGNGNGATSPGSEG
jgi:RNA polymerase-associated protein CTR9